MFKITPAAAEQIKAAAQQGGTEGIALRVAARENEDGSFAYNMGFDEPAEADTKLVSSEIEVIIDPAFDKLLEETTLDFLELDKEGFQFVFLNPLDPTYIPSKEEKKHH